MSTPLQLTLVEFRNVANNRFDGTLPQSMPPGLQYL
jgi:hypothetical protein